MLSFWHSNFAMPKKTNVISWLVGNNGMMVIYAFLLKFSKLCISCNLDEHLYAQLSKWALWLLFVMSKIKLSLVLNTCITFFDEKD